MHTNLYQLTILSSLLPNIFYADVTLTATHFAVFYISKDTSVHSLSIIYSLVILYLSYCRSNSDISFLFLYTALRPSSNDAVR